MADAALKRMTVDEFLAWDHGTDRRYELVSGEIVAMAPPSPDHGTVAGNLTTQINLQLTPACRVMTEAGIRLRRDDSFFQADLAVSCVPPDRTHAWAAEPILIIEVLSPTTEEHDRKVKLPEYRELPSVREIVLIDPNRVYCEVHRRQNGSRWLVDIILDQTRSLRLDSISADVPLSAVYAKTAVAAA